MIIGLCGHKRSGKDTIAAYLIKEYGFERKAFADPLKRSVAALFDIPFSEIDKLKILPNATITLDNFPPSSGEQGFSYEMMFRTFLQRYGTEAHREIFGQCFWVDITLPVQGFYPGRKIVVTDVRFREEAERVRTLGGHVVRVTRENAAPVEKDPHSSELIDFEELIDWTIENSGSLDELYDKVSILLERLDAIPA